MFLAYKRFHSLLAQLTGLHLVTTSLGVLYRISSPYVVLLNSLQNPGPESPALVIPVPEEPASLASKAPEAMKLRSQKPDNGGPVLEAEVSLESPALDSYRPVKGARV